MTKERSVEVARPRSFCQMKLGLVREQVEEEGGETGEEEHGQGEHADGDAVEGHLGTEAGDGNGDPQEIGHQTEAVLEVGLGPQVPQLFVGVGPQTHLLPLETFLEHFGLIIGVDFGVIGGQVVELDRVEPSR